MWGLMVKKGSAILILSIQLLNHFLNELHVCRGLDYLNNNDYLIIFSNHIDDLDLNKPFGDLGPLEWWDPLTLS